MIGMVTVAIACTLLIALLISSFAGTNNLSALSWVAFTAFPLLAVVLIASLARVQERTNIRAPQTRLESTNTASSEDT